MTRKDICSVDIEGLSKKNLRALIKVARTEWGQPIDLRSASEGSMCDYLRLYRQWKLDQEATEEPAAVEAVTHTLSDFEGIDSVTMRATDWLYATPLTCDVLSGQLCDLPQPAEVCEVCGNDINEAEVTVIAGVVAPEDEVEAATPLTCDVLEGAHNGSCCDTAMMPYYVSVNYSDETEGNYWFTWWAAFEYAKRQLVGATEARKHVMARPMPEPDPETERELAMLEELFYSAPPAPTQAVQPHPKQPTSPAIIGLCLLTTIALIAALIASVTVWAIRKVRDTRLVQKGFRAAASAINTRRFRARGFAGA